MSKTVLIATAALIGMGTVAQAAPQTRWIDQRQAEQAAMIEDGRRDGSITWREGLQLRREQREIAAIEAAYLSDGHLTYVERRVLRDRLEDAEEHIEDQASDQRRRLSWLPRFGR